MNDLERIYRMMLRWYPRAWRNKHGAALVDTLLSGAEGDHRARPSLHERFDIARAGLRERVIHAAPFALFVVAALGLLAVASAIGVAPQSRILFYLPAIPTAHVGDTYTLIATPLVQALWVDIFGSVAFIGGVSSGIALIRRARRRA
jgi:hypothetical protein